MLAGYGVLRGRIDRFQREDDLDTPHLQIRVVDATGSAWRVAVNVLSGDQSQLVFHRIDPLPVTPLIAGLSGLAPGFSSLAPALRASSTSLDYLRSPFFEFAKGVVIPSSGPGAEDDLQDLLVLDLERLRAQDGEIFVFGVSFPAPGQPPAPRPIDRVLGTRQGVHDVHMNQGNANPGPFARDNGVFQDGGLILAFPGRFTGLFLRFQTQWLPTDNVTGDRLPDARPVPPPPQVGIVEPEVYIERALVNPSGADVGREVVVLGNTAVRAIDVTGWRLVDRNGKSELLRGALGPGESLSFPLDGQGVQLGNQGGTLALQDPSGRQVHAVSYSKSEASREARYLRFDT